MCPNKTGIAIVGRRAIVDMLHPVALFAFDIGVDSRALTAAVRTALVRAAVGRLREKKMRPTVSSVSITTGLPRAVVAKAMRLPDVFTKSTVEATESIVNRILRNWHDDPMYLNSSGRPVELPIYGRGVTFESLARKYARSVPVRALLDELLRANAAKLMPNHRLRAQASIAVFSGLSKNSIERLRVCTTDLMTTLLHNIHQPKKPRFAASTFIAPVSDADLPIVRRKIAERAMNLLADLNVFSTSVAAPHRENPPDSCAELRVTVYVSEGAPTSASSNDGLRRRRNLSRR
jgi:Family of unknown function (DUF6502)